jgi:hypothetical protein
MSEVPPPPLVPWWRTPIAQGVLGLLLLVGGWKLSTWVPPHEEQQAATLDEVRRMSKDKELNAKLDSYAGRAQRPPPYQGAGRLILFAGLVLFVAAGVRMYRTPAPVEPLVPAHEPSEAGTINDKPQT